MTKNIEKTEVFNVIFTMFFTIKESQASETCWKIWSNETLFLVEVDLPEEHLDELNMQKVHRQWWDTLTSADGAD